MHISRVHQAFNCGVLNVQTQKQLSFESRALIKALFLFAHSAVKVFDSTAGDFLQRKRSQVHLNKSGHHLKVHFYW